MIFWLGLAPGYSFILFLILTYFYKFISFLYWKLSWEINNSNSCSNKTYTTKKGNLCAVGKRTTERLRFTFTANGKREFVPRDQVFPLFFADCLLLLHKNKWIYASFIHKNRSGLFLSAYSLFWEILNWRLPFVVCRKRES